MAGCTRLRRFNHPVFSLHLPPDYHPKKAMTIPSLFMFMSMDILPAHMYVHHMHSVLTEAHEGVGYPGIDIIGG